MDGLIWEFQSYFYVFYDSILKLLTQKQNKAGEKSCILRLNAQSTRIKTGICKEH